MSAGVVLTAPTPASAAPGAPTVSSPSSYSWAAANTITISGSAAPSSTVSLYESNVLLGTTTATSSGSWSRPVTLADGDHVVTARAADATGQSPNSNMLVVRI